MPILFPKIFQSKVFVKDGTVYNKVDITILGQSLNNISFYINTDNGSGSAWNQVVLSTNDGHTVSRVLNSILINPTANGFLYRIIGLNARIDSLDIKYKE